MREEPLSFCATDYCIPELRLINHHFKHEYEEEIALLAELVVKASFHEIVEDDLRDMIGPREQNLGFLATFSRLTIHIDDLGGEWNSRGMEACNLVDRMTTLNRGAAMHNVITKEATEVLQLFPSVFRLQLELASALGSFSDSDFVWTWPPICVTHPNGAVRRIDIKPVVLLEANLFRCYRVQNDEHDAAIEDFLIRRTREQYRLPSNPVHECAVFLPRPRFGHAQCQYSRF